jgi:tyrosine-protein kinase Etk/Wzc
MSSYSNNQNFHPTTLDEEIDLKNIFATLIRYKRSIIAIVLIVTFVSTIYAYFSTSVYQASLSLQIQTSAHATQDDFMANALDAESQNMDNEIAVLQSNFVAQKALEKVNVGTRYYTKSNLKTVELYHNSPFVVNTDRIAEQLIDYKFQLFPVDSTHFQLRVEPTSKMKVINFMHSLVGTIPEDEKLIHFNGIFAYNTPIKSQHFQITINKVGTFTDSSYVFTIMPNAYMSSWIQESLTVGALSEKGSMLQLGFGDNVPERAQEVLNAIADAYREQSIEAKSASAQNTLAFIDQQLQGIKDALQSSATNLENFKSSHIVIDPKEKGIFATQKLNELQSQRNEIEMQESVLKNLLAYIEHNKDTTGIDVGAMSSVSAPILSLIEKIQAADNARTSMVVDYTDNHPSVVKVTEQINKLKANLKATIESSLRGIQQRKTTLDHIMAQQNAALSAIPAQEKQLSQLSNSFTVNQKVYEYLLQKRAETAIVESSTVSSARVIDSALVGIDPIKPKRLLISLIGVILGFIVGIMQAFVRNYRADTIQSVHDVEKNTTLPIYSVLPFFKERKTLYEDALRVLLTKFEFSENKPQVIAIASSVNGEGRTTTALEFAQVIGKSGKKVIILDMDLRGSGINKKLHFGVHGMSTLLDGKSTLEEVVHNIAPNTDVIVTGPVPVDPYRMIVSETFEVLLKQLRSMYDYIILESPPVGLVADSLVLMQLSDLNFVVYKVGFSKKEFINSMNRFVQEHQLKNVGVIINGLELSKVRPWIGK